MEAIMLILALACTLLGIIIGDCAKWMTKSTAFHKLMTLLGGSALFATGMFMLAHCFGLI